MFIWHYASWNKQQHSDAEAVQVYVKRIHEVMLGRIHEVMLCEAHSWGDVGHVAHANKFNRLQPAQMAPERLTPQHNNELHEGIYSTKCEIKTNKMTRSEKQWGHRHNLAVLSLLPVARYGADGWNATE
jgi:hypothetical protein